MPHTMLLASRINLSIGVDCIGHAKYYERLFSSRGSVKLHSPSLDCAGCGIKKSVEGCTECKKPTQFLTLLWAASIVGTVFSTTIKF
jgi:hypothetical protein